MSYCVLRNAEFTGKMGLKILIAVLGMVLFESEMVQLGISKCWRKNENKECQDQKL